MVINRPTGSRPPLVVGLTGGIGSGKSLVSDLFTELGAVVIDTDIVSRQLVAAGSEGLAAVVDAFGSSLVDRHGELDRSALRRLIFGDDAARSRLEAILHPRIRHEVERQLAEVVDRDYALVVIPLLAERGDGYSLDRVVVVDADESLRRQRVARRDGVERQQIDQILAAQARREERLALADDIVVNNGSVEQVRARVIELNQLFSRLSGEFREKHSPPLPTREAGRE